MKMGVMVWLRRVRATRYEVAWEAWVRVGKGMVLRYHNLMIEANSGLCSRVCSIVYGRGSRDRGIDKVGLCRSS